MRQLNLENFRREDKTEMGQVTIFRRILGCAVREGVKLKHTCSFVHFLPRVCEQYPDNIGVFSFSCILYGTLWEINHKIKYAEPPQHFLSRPRDRYAKD